MSKPHYSDISDQDLESAIRGLPRRQPAAGLRERVLSYPVAHQPRRARAWRPAYALAALAVLLAADWLVVRSQDAAVPLGPSPQVTAARPESMSPDEAAFVRELAASGLPLRLAMRHPGPQPETYFGLRNRMLNEADGG
jgi:hypothetical protein